MKPDDLLAQFHSTRDFWADTHAGMQEFRRAYNGENPVHLDEMDRLETSSVPNLHQQGLDHLSQAIAGVVPHISFPAQRPGIKSSERKARESTKAMRWWWEANNMRAILRQRARYLPGYGLSAVVLTPDPNLGFAKWECRDPLTTFPAPMTDPSIVVPEFCFFTFSRTGQWLKTYYRDAYNALNKGSHNPSLMDTYSVLEYIDGDIRQCVVLGKNDPYQSTWQNNAGRCVELMKVPHGLDRPPVALAKRRTLERLTGHFDGIMEMHRLQATLMTLAVIGAKRSVFAEAWLEGNGNNAPKVVKKANAMTGEVGIVHNGLLKFERPDASFNTTPIIDRLERNQRVGASIPAAWGGESAQGQRTGRANEVLIDSTVEAAVMEYREALEDSTQAECSIAIDLAKRFFGNTPRQFFVRGKGGGKGDYTPNTTFETNEVKISYGHPSWDSSRMVIEAGQRIGTGLISKRTAMEMDPLIQDVEQEEDRITAEALRNAGFAALQAQAGEGALPLADVARIAELVESDKNDWWEAALKVQAEAAARQAAVVPADDPAAQPGLALPGMGMESQVEPDVIPGGGPEQADLATMIRQLRTTRNELSVSGQT